MSAALSKLIVALSPARFTPRMPVATAFLLAITTIQARAATFHVSIDGDDSHSGTDSSPFRSVQRGVNAAMPGDTVLIRSGDFSEAVFTVRSGDANSRIVVDGQSIATIRQFSFGHSSITLRNIRVTGTTQQFSHLVKFDLDAHFNRLTGCYIDAADTPQVTGIAWDTGKVSPYDSRAASDNLIEDNTITRVRGYPLVSMAGDRNIFKGNRLLDSGQVDFIRLWGRNNLITGNLCSNNYKVEGIGNHPDFIQTFGENGRGSEGHIIEGNVVKDIEGGQLTQLSSALLPHIGNWTFRNNVFMNIDLQASCSIPNVVYYNNVFYRCNTVNGGHVLSFGSREFTETKSYNGTSGTSYAHGCKAINNVFLDCGDPLSNTKGWYSFGLDLQGVEADYNYVGKINYAPVREGTLKQSVDSESGSEPFRWWEPHGINGGDPMFQSVANGNFRLLPNSPLIDRGMSILSVTSDFSGVLRPQGQRYDIGAFEFTIPNAGILAPISPQGLRVSNP